MLLMMMHTMLVLVFLMDLALLLDLVWDMVLVLVWVLALDLVLMVLLMDLLLHLVYFWKAMALSVVDPSVDTTVAKVVKADTTVVSVLVLVRVWDQLVDLVYLRKAMALSAVDPSVEVTTVAKAEKVASAVITVVKAAREEVRVVVSNMAMNPVKQFVNRCSGGKHVCPSLYYTTISLLVEQASLSF